MDDAALIRELNFLGVDTHTWPVLALLPLIQVACADGGVQDAGRALVLAMANREYQLDGRGHHALTNWLTHAPTEQYLSRGRSAARLLAARQPDIASADTMLAQCEAVARAAGGLLGFRAIDAREQAVLDVIDDVQKDSAVDADRVVLGGLSNGGHGAHGIGTRPAWRCWFGTACCCWFLTGSCRFFRLWPWWTRRTHG